MIMQERLDDVNGIRLHTLQEGEGNTETIIFLHGFPEFSYAWHKQLPFFATQGFHALAPDQRGYNLTSKPKGVKAYMLENAVEDLAAFIKKITSEKITLVGHDWGGGVAWIFAFKYPELLKKLVILNMPHPQVQSQNFKTSPKQMLKSWYVGFFQLRIIPEVVCRAYNFKFLEWTFLKSSNAGTFSQHDLQQYKQAWRQPRALTNMLNWYRAFKYIPTQNYGKINVPTLIIWGKKDIYLSAEMAQQSVNWCTNGKMVMLDDATHWLHHEKTAEVNKLILDFVQD
ncbi:alpha/beta hydrolase [Mucilaginibacter robiniae]|uniref:Alpha/beta hydrolase n=1 Tax=Mucilaginibacter robiniae TaxID=2728022 RepID=A0A7L5E419_9SPHI|nr:alpha/beta hydrolase [Mucilaginibacter robiniae]QJD97771.1 alpha/beta hydrolase [Mucilaginibacter robiniae]